jgi:hypothetical protein
MAQPVTLMDVTPTQANPYGTPIGTAGNPLVTTGGGTGGTPVLSAANSSAVNLAGAAAFTGTALDWTLYGSATITVYSSHASATNGLSVQQSMDNVNWFITDTFTVSATSKTSVVVPRQGQYFRVVYTNGGTLTTTFQLQTFLNPFQSRSVCARPGDAMTLENDFDQSISVQTLYNGTTADLQRSIANATNSNGIGITASGLVAQLDDTAPTAITENQFGNLRMSPNRSLLVTHDSSTPDYWSYAAAAGGISNTTTAVTVKAADGAGLRNYVKSMQLAAGALGAATEVVIRDGAAGTVLWRGFVTTAGIAGVETIIFDKPLKGTAATLLEVATLTATITGGVYVNLQGFVAP